MPREFVLKPFRRDEPLAVDYARELNPQQLEAVTAPPGPALIIAGAGSGKTRTLTYRVAYLMEQGVTPDRILLLTFTNKAAKEMMRRIVEVLGCDVTTLWGGTFHSIGHRILRRHADRLGFGKDFTILDREDSEDLIKSCVVEANIDTTSKLFPTPAVLASIFSMAVNNSLTLEKALGSRFAVVEPFAESVKTVWDTYEKRKRSNNVVDFDDLLTLWAKLLEEHEDIREIYQRRFQFVLVDEYQDTNGAQSRVVDLIAAAHKNVTAVGDDSQCIYSWRGANFRNIMEFPARYPEARIFKIEQNYRSTPEILELANAAIAGNSRQYPKHLVAARRSGIKPALVRCPDARAQAQFVAQRVLELREEGYPLREMAILYRSHFHALELQLELRARGIPFQITSGIRFFEQAHVKDVASYLKWVVNPADELSFKRIAGLLPGIGPKAAQKLWSAFLGQEKLWRPAEGVPEAPFTPVLGRALQGCSSALPKKASVSWAQLSATIAQLESPKLRQSPADMIQLVLEAMYEEYAAAQFDNSEARLEDLQQLRAYAQAYNSIDAFLADLSLMSNVEAEEEKSAQPGDDEFVRLSTVHQAKGLEFGIVFVVMLCEGLFPSARSAGSEEHLEEERRLFYVAVTRAKDELYLSYPLLRAGRGQIPEAQKPSRFVQEIPEHLVENCPLREQYPIW